MISVRQRFSFLGWSSGLLLVLGVVAWGCGGGGGGGTGGGGGGGTSCTDPYEGFPTTGTGKLIRGRVLNIPTVGGSNVPVANVILRFETTGGTLLQQTTTNACGAYQIDTGAGAIPTRLSPVSTSIPISYYVQYLFNGTTYAANIGNCSAVLPSFPAVLNVAPSVVLKTRSEPPPFPDGCLAP